MLYGVVLLLMQSLGDALCGPLGWGYGPGVWPIGLGMWTGNAYTSVCGPLSWGDGLTIHTP